MSALCYAKLRFTTCSDCLSPNSVRSSAGDDIGPLQSTVRPYSCELNAFCRWRFVEGFPSNSLSVGCENTLTKNCDFIIYLYFRPNQTNEMAPVFCLVK